MATLRVLALHLGGIAVLQAEPKRQVNKDEWTSLTIGNLYRWHISRSH